MGLATMGGPAAAQHWAAGLFSGFPPTTEISWSAQRQTNRRARHYYRNTRSARTVPLGDIVAQTGTDTRAAWQARLSRDAQRIGVPPRTGPRDRDRDGFDDPFDRWPNDPSRW
jgi:hypothetical protein